ncbi:MAG: cysteine peptidase family C39 domain-containing protein [Planctomycetota bacterium]|jgi:hypothetical protein
MGLWLETAGVILLTVLGVVVGKLFSRFQKPYWTLGYFLPLLLIMMIAMTRVVDSLVFVPPFCWVTAGRVKFVIFSLAVTMGLTTPLTRLPRKYEKFVVCTLMTVVVVWFSILPFCVPAVIKGYLCNLQTKVDSNGICIQSTNYTCGPAAAVTALRKLGLSAQEGEIAVLSHTSPMIGTLPRNLCKALKNRYGADGLECEYRHFESITQLKDAGVTLVVVKVAFLLDHCITVLEVSDQLITVADPIIGTMLMSHEQFEKIWRFSGIVLKRRVTQNI